MGQKETKLPVKEASWRHFPSPSIRDEYVRFSSRKDTEEVNACSFKVFVIKLATSEIIQNQILAYGRCMLPPVPIKRNASCRTA